MTLNGFSANLLCIWAFYPLAEGARKQFLLVLPIMSVFQWLPNACDKRRGTEHRVPHKSKEFSWRSNSLSWQPGVKQILLLMPGHVVHKLMLRFILPLLENTYSWGVFKPTDHSIIEKKDDCHMLKQEKLSHCLIFNLECGHQTFRSQDSLFLKSYLTLVCAEVETLHEKRFLLIHLLNFI